MSTNGSRALADSLVYPYLNHAASMYEEGYASREDIDNGMRFGCGLPKGPLTVIDELGLETVRDALAAHLDDCTVIVATHSDAVMRWSEVTLPPSTGTLRSCRISTRLPDRSRSVMRTMVISSGLS